LEWKSIMKQASDTTWDLEQLSALADGELDAAQAVTMVQATAHNPQWLQTWASYHAIGDVLRTHVRDTQGATHLGAAPQQVSARAEMAIAPKTREILQPAANDSVFRWKMVAGVASVAAVGSLLWSLVGGGVPDAQLAQRTQPAVAAVAANALVASSAAQGAATNNAVAVAQDNGVMIRDARLDELLAAHKQFGGASALQQPAGFLRNATFQSTGR
jgi:sigma-E factor negative regulatory protein RseA